MPYTYMTTLENGQKYIGWKSWPAETALTDGYYGSPCNTDENWKPIDKVILGWFETNEEAIADEIIWHDYFDVGNNPRFYNKAKQTSTGFNWAGQKHSDEAKAEMAEARAGDKNPMYGKKHSDATRQKIAEAIAGKKLSDETKLKLRYASLCKWAEQKGLACPWPALDIIQP